jgi:hypothetical protein
MTGLGGIRIIVLIAALSGTCGIYAVSRQDTLIKSREAAVAWTALTILPIVAGMIWFISRVV